MNNAIAIAARSLLLILCISASPSFAKADTYVFDQTIEEAVAEKRPLKDDSLKGAGEPQLVKKNSELKWKPAYTKSITVKLGTSAMEVGGEERTIYDFNSKKIYYLNSKTHKYLERSLFAEVAFREAELSNRFFLHKVVSAAFKDGKDGKVENAKMFDEFFSEAMLGLEIPSSANSGYKLVTAKDAGGTRYQYIDEVVTRFSPGDSLSADQQRQLSRFLLYFTMIHPKIRKDIELSAKSPNELMWYVDNDPVYKRRVTLRQKSHSTTDYKVSLPIDYNRLSMPDGSLLFPVFARLKEVGEKPPADAKEKKLRAYQSYIEKEKYLDALLTIMEYSLQSGDNLGAIMKPMMPRIQADHDTALLIEGLKSPTSEEASKKSLAALDSIDRAKHEKSYLLDIFRANLLINMQQHGVKEIKTTNEKDPAKAFISVLKVNPYITGVYQDLGDHLQTVYHHDEAWLCYALARKLYPDHPLLAKLNAMEKRLMEKAPQFFQGEAPAMSSK